MSKLCCAVALFIGCGLNSALVQADLGGAITVEATALRASASNGAASLQALPADTRLRILKRQGGWYQVQTSSGEQGWLALLAVRFDKAAGAKSGDIAGLLQGSTAVQPASSVATGVRGVTDDKLEAGASAGSTPLQTLERYAVTPSRARAFAQSGGLRSQAIAYPADAQ
jgi:uncharacterized protein YgiM (DUF1202 family)